MTGVIQSFSALLKRIFHGSSYGVPLAVYVLLFLNFVFVAKQIMLCLLTLALMIAGYLPFFIMHGYADRFAYVSSIPASLLLAWMILSAAQKRVRGIFTVALAALFIAYFGYSMQTRIREWKTAGEIARQIPTEIKKLHPSMPDKAVIYIKGVPMMYKNAYVFITGLEPAIQRLYGWAPIEVRMNETPTGADKHAFFFQYSNGLLSEVAIP
jgi:hypothetical protein